MTKTMLFELVLKGAKSMWALFDDGYEAEPTSSFAFCKCWLTGVFGACAYISLHFI